ncbi:MAG: hypothetical protein M0P26_02025 [Bacteroidales bacterium]|nr:hypothetical protein [Bacteroidales bacterium]
MTKAIIALVTSPDGIISIPWVPNQILVGVTRNVVYSQIWIANCTYMLIAIAKKMMQIGLDSSFVNYICVYFLYL